MPIADSSLQIVNIQNQISNKMHLESVTNGNGVGTYENYQKPVKRAAKTISPVSYPSQSLKFFQAPPAPSVADNEKSSIPTSPPQAKLKLRIVIVGAGLGGLATSVALARCGHQVTVLEQAHQLGEVCISDH